MAQDVSAEVAGMISGSKVFGDSDNIRHGTYEMVIRRIHAQKVTLEEGDHRMAFWEMSPLKAENNPQTEGDRVDYVSPTQLGTGPLKDDGTKPNPVGSNCAMKVDFDGKGGRSAGANIKAAILALFNKYDGEIPDSEIDKTWVDLSRRKPCKKGDTIGFNQATQQPIIADKDKQANPACGVVIKLTTRPKKKRTPNDKGMWVTKLIWSCAAPIGTGINSPELVQERRAKIEASMAEDDGDDEEETSKAPAAPQAAPQPPTPSAPQPPAPPAPSTAAVFTPAVPWVKHPNAPWGETPDTRFYWSDPALNGNNAVKSEAQLRAGQ